MTTEQKAFVAVSTRSERHGRKPRRDRGLIFGLIRLRSSTFISIQINAVMQVTDVNGIQRTIIPSPESRKVGGSTTARRPSHNGSPLGRRRSDD